DLPMAWLHSGLTFSVGCLILMWAAGSGSVRVLQGPTCFSDYINISTCEWEMAQPTNCRAELRLFYQLEFFSFENHMCVPENRAGAVCMCHMHMDNVVSADTYQLDLWAGEQLLWKSSFKPSEHGEQGGARETPGAQKPHCSRQHLPHVAADVEQPFRIYNVTYMGPTLRFAASTLKSGASYSAQVKAWAQSYNSTWSEWSPSVKWLNYYEATLEQRLPLGVSISCVVILAVCLSCYVSIIKIKKEWWDQIPNPAHSPLVAIVIQDSQVSLWGKRSQGQEPAKCPHWKTCLAKLLPCLLEHSMERDEDSSKPARNEPFQCPGKVAWHPMEVNKTILWPESISLVRCVELFEAQVENEEEEVEEDKGSFCPSPDSSGGSFQEGREGIAARLTESLFLDLLGGEDGGFSPQGLEESCLLPPLENPSAQRPWATFPSVEPQETSSEDKEPLNPESSPPTQSPARLAFPEMPGVIADYPTCRSFSTFLSQSSGPGELDSDPQLAEHLGEVDPGIPAAPQQSAPPAALQPEPETWEQILRQSVLQCRAAPGPASAPSSGYREFVQAVKQGGAQDSGLEGFGPCGEAGYKAFSSLLAGSGKARVEASPCCGCCRGDGASPPLSPLRALDAQLGGAPLEASLSPASLAPLGVSEEGKPPLFFQTAPNNAQSSSQTSTVVAMLSPGPMCTDAP
ncbi:hypothetical protein E2I00_004112, partial [Balaenoptera physalus]